MGKHFNHLFAILSIYAISTTNAYSEVIEKEIKNEKSSNKTNNIQPHTSDDKSLLSKNIDNKNDEIKPIRVENLFTSTWNRKDSWDITIGANYILWGQWSNEDIDSATLGKKAFLFNANFGYGFRQWFRFGGSLGYLMNDLGFGIFLGFTGTVYFLWDIGIEVGLGAGFHQVKSPDRELSKGQTLQSIAMSPSVSLVYDLRLFQILVITPRIGLNFYRNAALPIGSIIAFQAGIDIGFHWN